ncbi:DUF2523 domain-containing protein [Methylomonas rapida]|uniref:DUF2523 domain-containing protein n=1 Tax=Methylomonas rapida TaxID=2963939 RepID=A0ABY7GJY9_9GAMM|nr:DUF2523 domain-containing protein [Methylomonas rapida]WAR42976.1 DUF2523 domain-containing protein [Methylomonas rapida]WAR42988.1 DUF2523 domain-containing protein [Methylomonas rapida]
MNTIAAFLLSITGTLAARVLVSLGFGLISYAALTAFASSVIAQAQAKFALIDPTILQLLNLGGVGQFLGILAAGLTTRAAMMAIKKLRPL